MCSQWLVSLGILFAGGVFLVIGFLVPQDSGEIVTKLEILFLGLGGLLIGLAFAIRLNSWPPIVAWFLGGAALIGYVIGTMFFIPVEYAPLWMGIGFSLMAAAASRLSP